MKNIWLVFLLFFCVVILAFSNFGHVEGRVYDCSLSEISPDYPPEVKDECRKLRFEQWKHEREQETNRRLIMT